MRSVAIGRRGVIIMWGVTAGKASHSTSNARAVTAGKMGRNSSIFNSSQHVFRSQTVRYLQVAQTWNIIKFLFSASPSTPVSGSKCISSMQCKQEAYKDTDTDRGNGVRVSP